MEPVTVLANWHAILVLAEHVGPPAELPTNGLVVLAGGEGTVYTGVWGGDVLATGQLLDHAPDIADEWETVVEFSARVSAEHPLQLASREEGPAGPSIATEPGPYRVRISVQGRDAAYDLVADGTERYLLQAWPSAEGPLRVLRLADQIGQSLCLADGSTLT